MCAARRSVPAINGRRDLGAGTVSSAVPAHLVTVAMYPLHVGDAVNVQQGPGPRPRPAGYTLVAPVGEPSRLAAQASRLALARWSQRRAAMKPIDSGSLGSIHGGMKWEDFRRSPDVENRTGLTEAESLSVKSTPPAPLPKLVRHRGDLANQAGLDDMPWVFPN
jgi:hypothetical protein